MKVLKIGAKWCSGCLVMGPLWKQIEKENHWLKTEYFEYDDCPEIAKKYNLKEAKLPTFIFLDKKGDEFFRLVGEIEKDKILDIINTNKDR